MNSLTRLQLAAVEANDSSFLYGAAGTGKSTALRERLRHLLISGEPAYTMLVLIAEPEHANTFLTTLEQSGTGPYSDLTVTTYGQLARRMVSLFWPLVARPAGFVEAFRPPTFLGYDLAQLLMWRTITEMLAGGAFADLRLRPQQIVSQLLDTLNRAALNGLTLQQATARQLASWVGEQERVRHLEEAASAARSFRRFCLENNLLDLSLVVEVFDTQLVKHPQFHNYFSERFRHLMVDNVEEQAPAGQNFVASLMDVTATTAIAFDGGGGYKRFMAADPMGARQFQRRCRLVFNFDEEGAFTSTASLTALSNLVENYLVSARLPASGAEEAVRETIVGRYRYEMVDILAGRLKELIENGLDPSQIAIIAPYLDGAIRHSLTTSLKNVGIPAFQLRRRSSPREEPRVRAWLTWLVLAHPEWQVQLSAYDFAEALSLSIHGLDPARAQLATNHLFVPEDLVWLPASELPDSIVERIGPDLVSLVEDLRLWLLEKGGDVHPLDTFLHSLFHELLAQPSFQPEPDLSGAAVCDWLVRAAGRLRRAAGPMGLHTPAQIGHSFVVGIRQGLVTADPPDLGDPPDPNGVMISTIYGFLLAGRPVQLQVWLDAAASGWWDIPRQPLSNAFVLAQSWPEDKPWTMAEDFAVRNELLSRIIRGLTARCTGSIILATSDLDRRGFRQDGPLWRALLPVRPRHR